MTLEREPEPSDAVVPPVPLVADQLPWHRRRPVAWRHTGFPRLTLAWVLTNLADSTLFLVLAVWVKDLTGSDAAAAFTFALMGLPALLAPFLGQLADRSSRRVLLVLANFGVAAVVLVLLLVREPSQLWLLYAVTLVYSTTAYLTASAQSGLLRDMLPDEALASGNGLLTTIDQGFRLVAPLIGAGLYVVVGPHAVVAFTAVFFAGAGLVLLTLRVQETPPQAKDERGHWWHELSAGFRHLAVTPPLGRLTVLLAVAFGATGVVNAAIFPLMEQGLKVPASALGVLVSIQGVGAVLAGLSAAWVIGRWGEVRVLSLGVLVLAVAGSLLLVPFLAMAVVALFLAGFSVTWVIVAFVTLRQRLTPARLQGRTAAAMNMALNLPQTLATMAAAAVITSVDYRWLILVTAVGVLISAAAAPWRHRPDGPGPRQVRGRAGRGPVAPPRHRGPSPHPPAGRQRGRARRGHPG